MAYDQHKNTLNWIKCITIIFIILFQIVNEVQCSENELLSACQHLQIAENRRAKSLGDHGHGIRIPKCSQLGDFEPIQCSNEINGTECWCVDQYGLEIAGTRKTNEADVNCTEPETGCPASSCRMYCSSGFAKDLKTGCSICQCRDPCAGVECPGGLSCQQQEVKCKTEPCPPIPTCKKARSLFDLCPAGQPLSITDTARPFLCGTDPGKPTCPPLYQCIVQSGNDYGVCCPASLKIQKPGSCPKPDDVESSNNTGFMCGTPCSHDLECSHMQKCCHNNGCGSNCRQPYNVTACHQARVLSEILSVNEREGRGYIPQCNDVNGMFVNRQCSRNGLVCWCVDTLSGNKIKGTMGAANMVDCSNIKIPNGRSQARSFDNQCNQNICAAICEYGFKVDHNGCATCECSDPCEGFACATGLHCEVARDPQCTSGSSLCASEPICKPDIAISNPCEVGTPLVNNVTSEVVFCRTESIASRGHARAFFEPDPLETEKTLNNSIVCPADWMCTKLHGETRSVCCALVPEPEDDSADRQQSMCEYLRDFSDRMEGTEEGMKLAIPSPTCDKNGIYESIQCQVKKVKVAKSDHKRILEEQNVRQMRKLLTTQQVRQKRQAPNVKLYRIDTANSGDRSDYGKSNVFDFLKQKLSNPLNTEEEIFVAELLSSRIFDDPNIESRHAKLIDFSTSKLQNLDQPIKPARAYQKIVPDSDLVDVEIEDCWCVDGFGTEIPKTRSTNTTKLVCDNLKESLECLDLTCRMGCDYGFILDSDTQCPSCECRDPCDGISCGDGYECRTVEVSCEGEYCPPVPACLPRKPGQCPFLVPPGNEGSGADFCEYECRSDFHCEGDMRCCSNGCGTQCVKPQLKTACQHLRAIQIHQSVELGIPAKQKYIAQCDENDGSWKEVQCGPDSICWCVDEEGNERHGTRNDQNSVNCTIQNIVECPLRKCVPCEHGYLMDKTGCRTCECRDPCKEISCPGGEVCELAQVECTDSPCPKLPLCVPIRDSLCTEGVPLKSNGREVSCGPQSEADFCPTTHSCQLNPMTNKGVCCSKTRDVCFESLNDNCVAKKSSDNTNNIIKWKFSPKQNKCVSILVPLSMSNMCQSKNLFHSESACRSVCPVLSQCERLRLKNMLAAKRAGQGVAWFSPKCDAETGLWSPIQCLSAQIDATGRSSGTSVCWCADKKGAPIKGSLTRGIEPKCNHRQARRRMGDSDDDYLLADPVMEELIKQMTILNESDIFDDEKVETREKMVEKQIETISTATEKILDRVNAIEPSRKPEKMMEHKKIVATVTRCNALKQSASFPVECDANGSFLPTQCNGDICWCVDSAGNQLPYTTTFRPGTVNCIYTPVDLVEVELHLNNPKKISLKDAYDVLKNEVKNLLGYNPDNFRVHENIDGSILLRFDLSDDNKIDTAFALEETVRSNNLLLYNRRLVADITQSRFMHRNTNLPIPQKSLGITENTFHMIIFVLATGSAFLISIFVVYIMLKRGKNKLSPNKSLGTGDKYLDYSSPIFVLSANEKLSIDNKIDLVK